MHTIKTDAEKAHAIAVAAFRLHERLTANDGKWNTRSEYRLLDLCNAVIDLIDDGDCLEQRGILMDELHCDEAGNPLPPEPDDLARLPRGYDLRESLNPIACAGDA